MAVTESEPSEISSSETDEEPADWTSLGEGTIPAQTATEDKPPKDFPECAACGEPIIREPGARGRAPKYHPQCRPAKGAAKAPSKSAARTAAEKEAEVIAASLHSGMNKAAIVIGLFDKFDGYAIASQSTVFCSSAQKVLVQYPALRKSFVQTQGSGGTVALAFSGLCIALPIMAHHGIIPAEVMGKPIGKVLESLPRLLKLLEQRAAEASETISRQMEEDREEAATA